MVWKKRHWVTRTNHLILSISEGVLPKFILIFPLLKIGHSTVYGVLSFDQSCLMQLDFALTYLYDNSDSSTRILSS